jgi:hypothetical protein
VTSLALPVQPSRYSLRVESRGMETAFGSGMSYVESAYSLILSICATSSLNRPCLVRGSCLPISTWQPFSRIMQSAFLKASQLLKRGEDDRQYLSTARPLSSVPLRLSGLTSSTCRWFLHINPGNQYITVMIWSVLQGAWLNVGLCNVPNIGPSFSSANHGAGTVAGMH